MGAGLAESIRRSLESKSNDELLAIWTANDRLQWSPEMFDAIRALLTERAVPIPTQHIANAGARGDVAVCPACGSGDVKKRFFGGSAGASWACFIVGGIIALDEYQRPHPDPTVLFLLFAFVAAGIAARLTKSHSCKKCKTAFRPAK